MMLTPSRPSPANTTTMTPPDVDADRNPALAGLMGRKDKGGIEKRFIQIGEIQLVLFEVGEALRFVPSDFHDLFVATIYYRIK